jgi:hypothetical protein
MIIFSRLLEARRRFLAAGLSEAAFGLYTLPAGADAAVVGADLTSALSLFARQVGRQPGAFSLPCSTLHRRAALLRADQNGWVHFSTYAEQL